MPRKDKKRKWFASGLTLPGYNYLGPFNADDNGEPTGKSDAAAKKHDDMYKLLQREHGFFAPYFKFSKADEQFIQDASDDDYGGRWGKRFFEWKKKHAYEINEPVKPSNVVHAIEPHTWVDARGKKLRSVANLPPGEASAMDGGGSGTDAGLTETPIDAVTQVHRGPPDYTFASLPFYFDQYTTATQWSDQWTWRMTSPYDCKVGSSKIDQNVGAGVEDAMEDLTDAADAGQQQANWFDFYSSIYKYYHVISCRWHCTFENLTTEPLWVHEYYHNQTDLPVNGTNRDMRYWQGVKSHFVGSAASAILATGVLEANHLNQNEENDDDAATAGALLNYETGNHVTSRGPSPIIHLSGEYRPGDFKNEIHLDANIENWTLTNTNPALSERLSFRIRPQWDSQTIAAGDGTTRERFFGYRQIFTADYLVEFKELKDGIKYPIQTQPISITINQTRGAK